MAIKETGTADAQITTGVPPLEETWRDSRNPPACAVLARYGVDPAAAASRASTVLGMLAQLSEERPDQPLPYKVRRLYDELAGHQHPAVSIGAAEPLNPRQQRRLLRECARYDTKLETIEAALVELEAPDNEQRPAPGRSYDPIPRSSVTPATPAEAAPASGVPEPPPGFLLRSDQPSARPRGLGFTDELTDIRSTAETDQTGTAIPPPPPGFELREEPNPPSRALDWPGTELPSTERPSTERPSNESLSARSGPAEDVHAQRQPLVPTDDWHSRGAPTSSPADGRRAAVTSPPGSTAPPDDPLEAGSTRAPPALAPDDTPAPRATRRAEREAAARVRADQRQRAKDEHRTARQAKKDERERAAADRHAAQQAAKAHAAAERERRAHERAQKAAVREQRRAEQQSIRRADKDRRKAAAEERRHRAALAREARRRTAVERAQQRHEAAIVRRARRMGVIPDVEQVRESTADGYSWSVESGYMGGDTRPDEIVLADRITLDDYDLAEPIPDRPRALPVASTPPSD